LGPGGGTPPGRGAGREKPIDAIRY